MNVAIVGGGITGMAAAISLRRSGHKVTIFERSSLNNEIGAAINVPPNVGRFLEPLGLDSSRFVTSRAMYISSPFTLEQSIRHDHSRNKEKYGAPLYYAHRVDLHESLKRLATGTDEPGVPASIKLKSEVVAYVSQNLCLCFTCLCFTESSLTLRERTPRHPPYPWPTARW